MTTTSIRTSLGASIALMLLLCATGLWAGAAQDTAAGGTTSATERALRPGELSWMLDTSPVTLTAYMDMPAGNFNGWGNDPISTEITRLTGVSVEVETATDTSSRQLTVMLATNELPDFVFINAGGPMRARLWREGFASALNELWAAHAPEMAEVLPDGMQDFWTESDGNMYYLPNWYSDIPAIEATPGSLPTRGFLAFHNGMYEQLGSPAYSTLADLKAVLLQAKSAFPDLPYIVYDSFHSTPQDSVRNIVQTVQRVYGGGDTKAIDRGAGTVHLNFRDDEYFKALQWVNGLYRDGLYNPENFTITSDDQYKPYALNQQIFSYWGQCFGIYQFDLTEDGPYSCVKPPQEPGIQLEVKNTSAGIGGGRSGAISSTTERPARAIRYYQFLISDQGQMLTGHGIEGQHYTMEDGMPRKTQTALDVLAQGFGEYQTQLGIYNWQVHWLPMNWTDQQSYYWNARTGQAQYTYDRENYAPFSTNERLSDLIQLASDSDEKVIETQIFELWKQSMPRMVLADTPAQLRQQYDAFVSRAENLGLQRLEAAYTEQYQKWSAMLAGS